MFDKIFSKAYTPPKRILFVVKKRTLPFYDSYSSATIVSSGLKNSARFVVDMINTTNNVAEFVEVTDNNCIDREVTAFKPDIVIIEALWVVPSKFEVLKKLHPNVKWIVRLHSETPFIAHEGVAMEWVHDYVKQGVFVGVNSTRIGGELSFTIPSRDIVYLPNYYPLTGKVPTHHRSKGNIINIGCFGAIRPLKNHLIQAFAAIKFADDRGLTLHFHVNSGRIEDKGEPILRNLIGLFANTKHELIQHDWMNHEAFLDLLSSMDISMQVSLTETFNIVTADAVSLNIPIVVSPEVTWVSSQFKADPLNSNNIVRTLNFVWQLSKLSLQHRNYKGLLAYNNSSKDQWISTIRRIG